MSVFKKYYPIIFVVLFFFAMVSIVTVVDNLTRNLVLLQRDQETLNLFGQIFPNIGSYSYDEIEDIYTIYDNKSIRLGFIFYAEGMSYMGFAGPDGAKASAPMKILVGISDKETIQNLVVVEQKEDKPYWDMIVRKNFFDQFINIKIENFDSKRFGGVIDTVTGATVSCDSVIDIVKEAVLEKVQHIS